MTELVESARMFTKAVVEKYSPDQVKMVQDRTGLYRPQADDFYRYCEEPDEIAEGPQPGNLLTTVGLNRMTGQLLTNTQVWDNTHTGLAVGDSATAANIVDIDLNATTNKYYQIMDATYPQQSNGVLTFKATYGSGTAEFAWNEYGVIVPNTTTTLSAAATLQTNYKLFNHKAPASLGTKGAGSSWVFTVTITVS